MAAKGMSQTLYIIIAAVVILVAALVILTIFGTSLTPIGTMNEAQNNCRITNKQLCETTGQVSPTWTVDTFLVGDTLMSCADVCNTENPCNSDRQWVGGQC